VASRLGWWPLFRAVLMLDKLYHGELVSGQIFRAGLQREQKKYV
jgi:hypothetical protein